MRLSTFQEYQVTIRLACASTFAAINFACSSTAFARVVVYMPVPVVYAPPPRPVYYPMLVDPADPTAPSPVAVPATASSGRPPVYTTVIVPPPTNYAIVPAPAVSYAQPVMAVPY
jgi:hypothetical protein